MTPYPSYYLPPDLPQAQKPTHLPFIGGSRLSSPCGPDGQAGLFIGAGTYDPATASQWEKTPDGWFLLWRGQKPQQLVRLTTSPRILRWNAIAGHAPGDYWRIPVLLTPMDANDPSNTDKGYVSALDRLWTGDAWEVGADLRAAQEALLHILYQVPLAADWEARTAVLMDLVIQLLAFGHHVSRNEIIQKRWMTELLPLRIIAAAIDRRDAVPAAPAGEGE